MKLYELTEGPTPVLVSMPHDGTYLPADIAARMTAAALRVPDTDWHVARLYDFARQLGAGVIKPVCSRYVVDLNRPPDDAPLYPGASNTELCPLRTFDDEPIYRNGQAPDEDEVARRRERYWRPYHERLRLALDGIRTRHGVAVLFEAHSIRSRVPRFFDGRLPDFNLGTADGASSDASLEARCRAVLEAAAGFTSAVNGRFKGGYITRRYGDPAAGIHALQLEQAQITYMEETHPFRYREDRAAAVRPTLRTLLAAVIAWAEERAR